VIGVLVVLAGGIGAGSRFLASEIVTRRAATEVPIGTAMVNLLGAGGLGFVVGADVAGSAAAIIVGFLSGFTTYSTWMVESVGLWSEGRKGPLMSLINLFGLFVLGLGVAVAGWLLGGAL
jgi:CrcB protein